MASTTFERADVDRAVESFATSTGRTAQRPHYGDREKFRSASVQHLPDLHVLHHAFGSYNLTAIPRQILGAFTHFRRGSSWST